MGTGDNPLFTEFLRQELTMQACGASLSLNTHRHRYSQRFYIDLRREQGMHTPIHEMASTATSKRCTAVHTCLRLSRREYVGVHRWSEHQEQAPEPHVLRRVRR